MVLNDTILNNLNKNKILEAFNLLQQSILLYSFEQKQNSIKSKIAKR